MPTFATRLLSPALICTISLLFGACTDSASVSSNAISSESASSTVKVDGSSTVYPITEAAAKVFQAEQPNTKFDIQFSGTTGGFRRFCKGETDISNASRPISKEEILACRETATRYIELPIAFDALVVVVNPKNTWAKDLKVSELKAIWESAAQGQIKSWNQVRPDFPNQPLVLYGPGKDSGTYDYFAEVIAGAKELRGDYTGSEDDNELVQGVATNPNALGFFGFSYYENNPDKLRAVAILDDSREGSSGPVEPSNEAIEKATYQPLSRPLFIYVNGKSAQNSTQVRDFVQFYLKNARDIVTGVDYAPLPQEAYDIGQRHLFKGDYGTAYAGKPEAYLTILEVLQKEQSF